MGHPADAYEWFTTRPILMDDGTMTVGIGVICEDGRYVVLATDSRASYGQNDDDPKNDAAGKLFDFHPLKIIGAIAGGLTACHNVVGQLTIEIDKLLKRTKSSKPIYREHLENALNYSRRRECRRMYENAARLHYGISREQLLRGKLRYGQMNEIAWQDAKNNVFKLPLEVGIIIGGFLDREPVLLKAVDKRDVEGDADPPICVIGTGGRVALRHLSQRGQHIYSGIAQTLLHIHESVEAARAEDHFVGPTLGYVVMSQDREGYWQILHDTPCLTSWAKAYADRESTDSLNNDISRHQVLGAMTELPPGPRFARNGAS